MIEGNWGDYSKIDPDLISKLEDFQTKIGLSVIVTSGYRPQSDGSQHQLGKAADIMVPSGMSLLSLYKVAEDCGFTGIGIYPDWRLEGKKLGGLHVDVRDRQGPHAKWMGVSQGGGKQVYIALNDENLQKYGVV